VTGYLNHAVQQGYVFNEAMMACVSTKTSPHAASTQVNWMNIAKSGTNWTLAPNGGGGGGGVTSITGTSNQVIASSATGAITLSTPQDIAPSSSPTFAALKLPGGAFLTTVDTDASIGQSQNVTIPDVGNSLGRFLMGATATPFTNGNFPMNSGTGGLMVDSGLSVSAISAALGPLNKVIYIDFTLLVADLNTGTQQAFVLPAVAGQSFKIRSLMCNVSTGLSGGGGDRGLWFRSSSAIYNAISAGLVQAPVNTIWGGTGMVFGITPANQTTDVNDSFWFEYTGGTTDYTDGTVSFTIAYERIS